MLTTDHTKSVQVERAGALGWAVGDGLYGFEGGRVFIDTQREKKTENVG